jgi:predicted amidohydrolase YtcJ
MPQVERLIVNTRALTMDAALPEASAFAIRGRRIVAVGESAALLAQRERDTEVVDLGGQTVLPGFIDAHTHFAPSVFEPIGVDLSAPLPADIPELQARIAAAARATPAGGWIRGFGYNEGRLKERRHPTRGELDEAAPAHPVVAVHWSYHRAVANSRALAAVGLGISPPRVPEIRGGVIHRDANGNLTGLLSEAATDGVQAQSLDSLMARHATEILDLVEARARRFLALGITAVQDAWVSPACYVLMCRTAEAGRLPLYYTPLRGSHGVFGSPRFWLERDDFDAPLPPRLRRGGIKLLAHGVFEQIVFYSQCELNDLVARAHCKRLTVAIHATHDLGIDMALEAAAHARRAVGPSDGRIRVEHFFGATDAQIRKARDTGVGIVTQPALVWDRGDGMLQRKFAPENRQYPIGQLRAAGVPVAGSSDAPCFPLPPLWGIGAAAERRTRSGARFFPEQAVSVEEAVRLYTMGAAWAGGTEDEEGSITPGKLANFVVLSSDPREAGPGHIRDLRVEQTWVDGSLAYRRTPSS